MHGGRSGIYIGHDGGDELPDFLDFGLAAVRDHASGDGLGGEQRSPRDAHFGIGAGPFAAVEGLHGELDEDLIRGMRAALGRPFDPFPLFARDPDVLVQGARRM